MSGRALGKPRDAGTEAVLRRVLAKCGEKTCTGKMRSVKLAKCGAKPGLLSRTYSSSRFES